MKTAGYLLPAGLLCFLAGASPITVCAQEAPQPIKVAPGYEPLALAAQWAASSRALTKATEPGATLTQKRRALSEEPVAQALDLLRHWLDAPALPSLPLDVTGKGLTPILSGVFALERALTVRNYVLLADGRVGDAIDSLRAGLRLSYAIGNDRMSSWLTGVHIETTLTQSLLAHLDEFSVQDCDVLFRLAEDWANAPDPLPLVLEHARLAHLAQLEKTLTPEGWSSLIRDLSETSDGVKTASQMEKLTPQARQQVRADVLADIDAAYRQAQLILRTPYWERAHLTAPMGNGSPPDDLLARRLVEMAMPDLGRTADRYTQTQATARLLGCRAAIRRYQWEHDSLPSSLAKLQIGDMAVDPFTGKPFFYKTEGAGYTLESGKPSARDHNGPAQPN